jgi:TonB family protein
VIYAPRDTHNAGVEDGEAPTARFRRFLGVLIPLAAVAYIFAGVYDFDARWPDGIALGDAVQDEGMIISAVGKSGIAKFISYEAGERCVRLSPRARTQIAKLDAKGDAAYDARVRLIPRFGRDICGTSPIPFSRFYDIVSVDKAAVIGCAPDRFIALGRQCSVPKTNPLPETPPAIPAVAPLPLEKPTKDGDPPPPVPYRPFAAEPPPPVIGLDGANVSMSDFYPDYALQREQQGAVRVSVTYVPNGRSISCTVLQSSGSSALDRQTCRLVGNHPMFTPPAANIDPQQREVTISQGVRWALPQ